MLLFFSICLSFLTPYCRIAKSPLLVIPSRVGPTPVVSWQQNLAAKQTKRIQWLTARWERWITKFTVTSSSDFLRSTLSSDLPPCNLKLILFTSIVSFTIISWHQTQVIITSSYFVINIANLCQVYWLPFILIIIRQWAINSFMSSHFADRPTLSWFMTLFNWYQFV